MASITVRTHSGEVHQGVLFCVDPVTKAIVLEKEAGVYTLINPAQIAKIDEELVAPRPNIASMGLNVSTLEKKEEQALMAAEKNLDSINKDVSPQVQNLYDRMALIFPTKWEGNTMVILDNVNIDPPNYDKAVLTTGSDSSQLEFVAKMLAGVRSKLSM